MGHIDHDGIVEAGLDGGADGRGGLRVIEVQGYGDGG